MLEIQIGVLTKILFSRPGITAFKVKIADQDESQCIAYPDITGDIAVGDKVLLNTTAVTLDLGSGGFHFVIAKLDDTQKKTMNGSGHIMKMRYTSHQIRVLSVEEEESSYHEQLTTAHSLGNTPVLVATLHSMLTPLAVLLNQMGMSAVYIMTDGAALPMAFSQSVYWLKKNDLLLGTITYGHAFGGDLEAVNIYSALLAAYEVYKPDVIIVCMGPGIVGTGTKWGFTGIEQGQIINAAGSLNGRPIAVPRISFMDPRPRHQGLSHHTLTVLSKICLVPAIVPLPLLEEELFAHILTQLKQEYFAVPHRFCVENNPALLDILRASDFEMTVMGRTLEQEREFFLSLGAAASTARRLCSNESLSDLGDQWMADIGQKNQ